MQQDIGRELPFLSENISLNPMVLQLINLPYVVVTYVVIMSTVTSYIVLIHSYHPAQPGLTLLGTQDAVRIQLTLYTI